MSDQAMTATLVRDVTKQNGARGEMRLYRLSPPLAGWEFVVVSAVAAAFDTGRPETYIFPSSVNGGIAGWGELPGSFQGDMDHEAALSNAGYAVADVLVVAESAARKAVES
ncbi:hypothetical protein ACFVR6_03850 [Microbacterium sp. NPDC058021]|uniref:hypothetical protein n=1 Tax=Microbacterium sp. NPDC058021 TaxID=3346306 RepID=UPI0036D9D067